MEITHEYIGAIMIPASIISLVLSLFNKDSTPEVVGDIKDRVFNKTNSASYIAIVFIIGQLTQNPQDHFYQFSLLFCVFMITIRDTAYKVIVALKELKESPLLS